jgi:hypothetical protein
MGTEETIAALEALLAKGLAELRDGRFAATEAGAEAWRRLAGDGETV